MGYAMRGRLIGALAGALLLTVSACTGTEDSGPETPAAIAVSALTPQEPLTPAEADDPGMLVLEHLFSGLTTVDADGAPGLEVAASIDSDDMRTWTIEIAEGWTFHDGTPVDAEAFARGWNLGAAGPDERRARAAFGDIAGFERLRAGEEVTELEGVRVASERELIVELTGAAADFELRLASLPYVPLPVAAVDDPDAFARAPVGNGPYRLAGSEGWVEGTGLDLLVHDDYAGSRPVRNGGIALRSYTDLAQAYSDVRSADLDVLTTVPDEALAEVEQDEEVGVLLAPGSTVQSLVIPAAMERFSGPEGVLRRRAVSLAIDRETIVDELFARTRPVATDLTSPLVQGHSEDLDAAQFLGYDPDRAQRFWARADRIEAWSGTLRLAYNTDGGHEAWVSLVADQIAETLEVEVELIEYESFEEMSEAVVSRRIKAVYREGWLPDYPSALNYLVPRFVTGEASNGGDYSSKRVDDVLRRARQERDPGERARLVAAAQERLLSDLPAIPLWYGGAAVVFGQEVSGVRLTWSGVLALNELVRSA